MTWWLCASGVFLLLLALVDFIWTVLTIDGGGPLTRTVARWVAAATSYVATWRGGRNVRPKLGAVVLLGSFASWVGLTWIGWLAVFSSDPRAIIDSQTLTPADLTGRIYYVGYTLSTLGMGDYEPGADVWRVLTAIASAHGFFLFTLSVAYLLPVVSAVVNERRFAMMVSTLGEDATEIVARGFDGDGFEPLLEELRTLRASIVEVDQQHAAYPVLHQFMTRHPQVSFPLALARIEEVVNLLEAGVARRLRPHRMALHPLRRAIEEHLDTLRQAGIRAARTPPPLPDLEALRGMGVETVDPADFSRWMRRRAAARRFHRGLVEAHGWSWRG